MRTLPFGFALAVLTGAFLIGACSGPPTFQSQSLSRAPSIDGELSEWGGTLARVKDSPVSMSVAPTDSMLYVALLMPERDLMRAVAKKGLIVWVDPSDAQKHTYGLQYPLGLRAAQRSRASSPTSGKAASLDDLFPSDLIVIRNDTIQHRMPAGLSSNLRVKATLNTGALIYEAAIPVPRSTSGERGSARKHGLLEPPGSAVAIGVETPNPKEDSDRFAQSSGIPSVTGQGGRRGRGRRGRSPRGRRRGGQRGSQPSSASQSPDLPTLDLWMRVVPAQQ